jgi:hypothetical protein
MTPECLIRAVILATGLGAAPTANADPLLQAWLAEQAVLARRGEMRVEIRVSGVELVDPASVRDAGRAGQGHVHYRVDGGAVIATPATSFSVHELAPGPHEIEVTLVGNDHEPLGPPRVLRTTIPARDVETGRLSGWGPVL